MNNRVNSGKSHRTRATKVIQKLFIYTPLIPHWLNVGSPFLTNIESIGPKSCLLGRPPLYCSSLSIFHSPFEVRCYWRNLRLQTRKNTCSCRPLFKLELLTHFFANEKISIPQANSYLQKKYLYINFGGFLLAMRHYAKNNRNHVFIFSMTPDLTQEPTRGKISQICH